MSTAPTTIDIPVLDPRPEIESVWDEVSEAVHEVLCAGRFSIGPNVPGFEQ